MFLWLQSTRTWYKTGKSFNQESLWARLSFRKKKFISYKMNISYGKLRRNNLEQGKIRNRRQRLNDTNKNMTQIKFAIPRKTRNRIKVNEGKGCGIKLGKCSFKETPVVPQTRKKKISPVAVYGKVGVGPVAEEEAHHVAVAGLSRFVQRRQALGVGQVQRRSLLFRWRKIRLSTCVPLALLGLTISPLKPSKTQYN